MKHVFKTLFLMVCSISNVHANDEYGTRYFPGMEEFPKVREVKHKEHLSIDAKPQNLLHDSDYISHIRIKAVTPEDPNGDNLQWEMELPFRYVFLSRLSEMKEEKAPLEDEDIWGRSYKYLEITFERTDGKEIPPYRLFKNKVTVDHVTFVDTSKEIENWVFATVNNYKQLNQVNKLLNIDDFKRCKQVGNKYDELEVERCTFPDGTEFLNINTEIRPDTIRVSDFDSCFTNKNPLVATFPRKCIAPGGRLYTEQPKVR